MVDYYSDIYGRCWEFLTWNSPNITHIFWYCSLSSFYYAIITDLLFTAQFDAHCYSSMQVVTFSILCKCTETRIALKTAQWISVEFTWVTWRGKTSLLCNNVSPALRSFIVRFDLRQVQQRKYMSSPCVLFKIKDITAKMRLWGVLCTLLTSFFAYFPCLT